MEFITSDQARSYFVECGLSYQYVAKHHKIEFGTDDNERWWAHEVPFFGTVQMDKIVEHGLTEWDIYFNECWQGPFATQAKAIKHLEECIQEMKEEQNQ